MNWTRRLHTRQTTFRQLEIFMAVADHASVTLAAKALHLAQPTVSTQIAKLAESLECQLFELVSKKMCLTDTGQEVLDAARKLFAVMDNLEARLAKRAGLSLGHLRISVVTTAKYLIPHWLGEFCEQYPNIEPEFQIGNRAEIIQRLKQNLDDLYVFSNPPRELEIEAEFLTHNPLVVIAKQDHVLKDKHNIKWHELYYERLLMRENGSGTRFAIEAFFKNKNVKMQNPITIASNEAIKESVMAGLGIAIVSRHALNHMAPGNLIELAVEDFPIPNSWYWVLPKGKNSSSAAKAFQAHVNQGLSEQVNLGAP
ncbi:LysR family transcriptional regulator [Glaciecola punicea]|jgi:DNA-binding transcriptional LysR family regulator|nr:LysR family transcriptional regulator [Glaciecola punicea]OFA30482.1 LysR family transcriptional regulator [Glaciecola punicea]